MKTLIALALSCSVAACASTYAPDPNDPVDMTGELSNRAQQYVGMASVCDATIGGARREAVVEVVRSEQGRLGALAGLVNVAYRGSSSPALIAHMQSQMSAHDLTAAEFCGEVLVQAEAELEGRTSQILAMGSHLNTMEFARQIQDPHP